jgi:CheY-like chemotaxis protein
VPIVVLVVEDEPFIRMDVADHLTAAGYEVLEASNADEAIALLEHDDRVRLIFTDVDMPGSMDGLRLAAAVANRWPPVRIIVASGHRVVEITDIPDGSVFFSKPYRFPDIISSIRELLHQA